MIESITTQEAIKVAEAIYETTGSSYTVSQIVDTSSIFMPQST